MEAVAVAGAGAAVGATIKIMLENLLSYPMEEIGLHWNFKRDLQKLKDNVTMIRDFLVDAEMKQVTEKSVQRWLMKLEDVAFDADYVFDQLNYQHLRKKVQRGSKMKKKVRCFFPNSKSFSFHHRMARKIKNVRDEFKKINQEAKELGLHVIMATAPARGVRTDESNAYYKDPVFVGRENDARKIVEMVNNSPTDKAISAIPIVGMGGLGKTTLARKVFHDHTILSRFDENCRLWIHVSETFVPKTVFEEVLKLLTGEIISGQRDQFVLGKLQEKIKDKRYLLVLDDVWCDDREKWDKFINPLEAISSLKGNVVIITTRNTNVASIVKTNDMHELRVLSDEDCWGIIKAKAFKGDNIPSEFEKIVGKRIAERCGGLPLAAKVIGGLLSGKTEDEWSSIENKWLSDFEGDGNNVSKILKLSFDYLPSSSSKKCFAYCSILPKGWLTEREELIHLWMAEGFLQIDQETDMEIAGNKVLNILLQSSLLQVQERGYSRVIRGYGMHDLVHDLASSILNSKFLEGAHQVRYKSIPLKDESALIPKEHTKLRGLFCGGEISLITFSKLKCLHVLILNDGEMKELPIEIGKLISLRLLDISNTKMEYLPDSIGDLYHLQTLRATKNGRKGCLRKLPNTFKFLTSLRHLYIPLIELPPEIGKVTSLRTLPYFQVGDEEGRRIVELGSLKNLEGEMDIHNLENVRDKEEAKNADLFHKPNMLKLKLVWSESREDDHSNDEKVLEGLQPHSNLKCLKIKGFRGTSFPSWTMRMDFDNLLEIKLSNCSKCEEIPMLGHLPHLKSLYLSHLSNVKSMGSSFYGIKEDDGNKETIMVFPELEKLVLDHMENLTSWTEVELSSLFTTQPREALVFGRLEYLEINCCRQLKSAPSHFPCLKELEIESMESGVPLASICGSKLTTLRKLKLHDVDGVVCLPDLLFNNNHDLLELDVIRCSNLTHLVPCLGGGGASLRKLEITNCQNLVELPEDVDKLNALEELRIMSCPKLKSIAYPSGTQLSSQGFTSLRRLEFILCSGLTNLPCEMLESCALSLETLVLVDLERLNLPQVMSLLHKMSHLTLLEIKDVPKLGDVVVEIGSLGSIKTLAIGGRTDCGDYVSFDRIFPAFQCLGTLYLYGMEEWDGLPEQLQHLTTLHELWLWKFGIEELPEWIERLSSLRKLYLWECKKLRHLPSKKAMRALIKLTHLNIYKCSVFEQGSDDDSEWSKVSHIPDVYLNGWRWRV